MRKPSEVIINGKTLEEILENHLHWLEKDVDGWEDMRASLRGADISNTDLRGVNLRDANLDGVNFYGSDLRKADFRNCNLYHVNFRRCNLWGANLVGAKDVPYIPLRCPSDGAFIGWKRIKDVLVKLEIPADAKRSSATTNKCRCEKAKVLGFYDSLGLKELNITELENDKYEKCKYVKGEMVYPDSFDEDRWNEYGHGIHFFIYKQDAINY